MKIFFFIFWLMSIVKSILIICLSLLNERRDWLFVSCGKSFNFDSTISVVDIDGAMIILYYLLIRILYFPGKLFAMKVEKVNFSNGK